MFQRFTVCSHAGLKGLNLKKINVLQITNEMVYSMTKVNISYKQEFLGILLNACFSCISVKNKPNM